jgi:peroxiredoxin
MRNLALLLSLLSFATTAQAAMLAPGDSFPAWRMVDQTGAKVSSRDLAGKSYLLWYYVKASTPG